MEYADGKYLINGDEMTEDKIKSMIEGFKSIYVITEYLFMHKDLKKIYPYSVNTIRVAVVNQSAYEPKIMQTYMRALPTMSATAEFAPRSTFPPAATTAPRR